MAKTASWGWQKVWALALLAGVVVFCAHAPATLAQSGNNPPQQPPQSQPAQEIPDAPSAVQPPQPSFPSTPSNLPPRPEPAQPDTTAPAPAAAEPSTSAAQPSDAAPVPKPVIQTAPRQGGAKNQINPAQDLGFTMRVYANFVQIPVTVKSTDGRPVDGLLPKDFTVLENGQKQTLTFFTTDPFALSVAVVLDLGLPDAVIQKVNQTFSALAGSFSPYDEVSLYTYSSTVSEVSGYTGSNTKLTAVLNEMKLERGRDNGVPVMSGPMASGPIVNGIPIGGGGPAPVNTPPREAHVLNDAILRAALDLSKRDRTRRKVIFVISDGREMGSTASYSDVLKVLLAHEIQVKAVALDTGAFPGYNKIERLHLPLQGRNDLLPKYVSATGGGQVFTEFSVNAMEEAYAQITSEARNQYTLGYTPHAVASTRAYRDIEILVDRPGLKVYAKDRYYPIPSLGVSNSQ